MLTVERGNQRLGLANLGHCQPAHSGRQLEPGNLDALMGFAVRPHGDAVRRGVGSQPLDVSVNSGSIDDERRRRYGFNARCR